MEIWEAVKKAFQELVMPELEEIKNENKKINVRLELTNKRLDDINLHLAAQSRRIDETNKRIDGISIEITKRINQLTFQVGKLAQEMERIKREEKVTEDIITRISRLEKRVIGE